MCVSYLYLNSPNYDPFVTTNDFCSRSKSAAWGDDVGNFPETLFDYMRQKKWERSVYHDDLKRAHTAKYKVERTKRQTRQELLKELREKQKSAAERAKTVGPLVYRNRQGRVMKTDTPGVRLTEKLVQPVTRMKCVSDFQAFIFAPPPPRPSRHTFLFLINSNTKSSLHYLPFFCEKRSLTNNLSFLHE